jgi:hypothetical protein
VQVKIGSAGRYLQEMRWKRILLAQNTMANEYKKCRFRTTLRSGTVMEGRNLPYITAMAFLTRTKKSISALELQKKLGHKWYEPIWAMLHKLQLVMRHRDSLYELKDFLKRATAETMISK